MQIFLYVISLLWIAAGVCFILYTDESRGVYKAMLHQMNRIAVGIIPIAFGILFFAAAGHSRNSWFIILLGILGLVKGVVILFNPSGFYEKSMNWMIEDTSDQTFRFFGIMALILGTAVLSWIV